MGHSLISLHCSNGNNGNNVNNGNNGNNVIRSCVLGFEDFIFPMAYWLCSENIYADII